MSSTILLPSFLARLLIISIASLNTESSSRPSVAVAPNLLSNGATNPNLILILFGLVELVVVPRTISSNENARHCVKYSILVVLVGMLPTLPVFRQ